MALLLPEIPPEVPRTGNALSAAVGRMVLRALGWKVTGTIPASPRMVLIVAPHSSAWDFVIGMSAKFALRLESSYLAKESLFRWPLATFLRRTGGIAVDRSARHHLVERMAERFSARQSMLLALTPEGTRRQVASWKTGFYRIAEAAGVPILPVALDYRKKAIVFGEALVPSGDLAGETERLRAFFAGVGALRRDAARLTTPPADL